MDTPTIIKIFVSCPGDLENEKEVIRDVSHALQVHYLKNKKNILFHIHYWKDIVSEFFESPQNVINKVFDDYHIYIGMLHMRFGTPTGNKNEETGQEFGSGTEEEFTLAVHKKNKGEKIKLFFFFKEPIAVKEKLKIEQLAKVIDFKDEISHTGFVHEFKENKLYIPIYTVLLDYVAEIEKIEKIEAKNEFIQSGKSITIEDYDKSSYIHFRNNIPAIDYYIPRIIKPLKENQNDNPVLFKEEEKYPSLYELVLKNERIVLLGNAGFGKSIELLHLVQEVESNSKAPFVAIFKRLNTYVDENLEDFLPLGWQDIPEELLLVVLDGLDEIQQQNFNTASRKITSFADKYNKAHIVISSRTNFYDLPTSTTNGTLTNFDVFFIEEITSYNVKEFVTNNHNINGEDFINKAYHDGYFDLIFQPFFLKNIIPFFNQKGNFEFQRSKIIKEIFVSKIEHDENHYRSTFNIRDRKNEMIGLLQKIALVMESLGRNFLNENELLKILNNTHDFQLIKFSTAFTKKPGKDDIWMFDHNNIQEYLAATALSDHNLDSIKKFISFPPNYTKIKPSWVNTLSFLISVSDNIKSNEIINWVNEIEPEIIIKFEPERVAKEVRIGLFKQIFNNYKSKNIWISSNKFNDKELARFSQFEETIDFLLDELKGNNTTTVKLNAIHLIDKYDLKKVRTEYKEKVKEVLIEILENTEDSNLIHTSLSAIANLRLYDSVMISDLVSKFRSRRNQYIRSGLYYLLNESEHTNDYIDVYLEGILIENEKTAEDRESVNLFNESWGIREGLKNATTPEALKKIFAFYRDSNKEQNFYYHDQREIFSAIIDNTVKAFQSDSSLFNDILDLLKSFIKIYDTNYSTLIASFFKQTNTEIDVFKIFWADIDNTYQMEMILSILISKPIINFFIEGYLNHNYTNSDIDRFYKILIWNSGHNPENLISFYEEQIAAKTSYILQKHRTIDQSELHRKRRQESFDLLFDMIKLQQEVNNIFEQFGREELEWKDFWDYRTNGKNLSEESFPISAFNLVKEFTFRGNTASIIKINNWFETDKNVKSYQIREIYEKLKDNSDLKVVDEQIDFVKSWCLIIATYDKIASAVKVFEDGRSTFNQNVGKLWFFIKRFKIILPENVLLAFTLFEDFGRRSIGDQKSEIDELEDFIEKNKIEDKVINNLQLDITTDRIWKNNALYAINNGLESAYSFIIRDLKNESKSKYHRPDVVKAFYLKTKNISVLQELLTDLGVDDLTWAIVDQLIDESGSNNFLIDYLQSRLKKDGESLEDKLQASKYLIELDNINGIKFYSNYILEKHDPKFEYDFLDRSFSKIKTLEALPIILDLLKLAKKPDFQVDKFNRLDSFVLDALFNIGMSNEESLQKVIQALRDFIVHNNNSLPNLNFLYFNIERLEQQFYMEKSKSLTLDEAIKEYQYLA